MTYRVELQEGGCAFDIEPGESLVDGAERAGLRLPHDCRFGTCGTCRVRLVQGRVAYEDFPPGLSPEEAAAGFALACQARACSDLVLRPERALAPCSEPHVRAATVKAVHPLGPDVTRLALRLDAGPELVFRPGQYVNLLRPGGEKRSFSMASRPDGLALDFHIRRIPGGRFTDTALGALQPGDRIDVELPLGTFCHRPEDYRPLLFVATGTGVAPIKSILESLMDDPDCPPVELYWGMRTEADLYLHAEIQAWASRFEDFRYVPVLSRAAPAWQGRRGHVQEAVAQDHPQLDEYAIYLCGSPAMVDDARRTFLALGASIDHIYSDSFTFQPSTAPAA